MNLMKTIRLLTLFLVGMLCSTTMLFAQYDYLGLVGDASPAGWNPNGYAMDQDPTDPTIFTYSGPLKAGELKIHTEAADWGVGDWIMPGTNGQSITETSYIITQGDPDNKWLLTEGEKGSYLVTVDLGEQTITFTRLDYYPSLFLIGSATSAGWDVGNGLDMTADDASPAFFQWVGPLVEGAFKIGTLKTWDDGWDWIMPVTHGQDLALNEYKIVVSPPDPDDQWVIGADQAGNYRVTVDLVQDTIEILAVNADATLSEITLSTGTLSPAFDPAVEAYFVTVDAGTTSVDVAATTTDPAATVEGAGTVDVSSGSGTAMLVVTADDGLTTQTYTVNIDVGASTDANLSSLTVTPGELTPAFSPAVTAYSVVVPEGTTSAEVSATTNNAAATLTGTGTVDLSSGAGTATIEVTAEDATTIKTYTVDITVFVPTYYETLYMIGPATPANWDIANPDPMTVDPDNEAVFTWEDTLMAGQFKIVSFKGNWCEGDEIVPVVDNQVLTATDYEINSECAGNDHKWLVEVPGVYNVEVDLENEVITITLVQAIDVTYDMVYLLGDATPAGWIIAAPEPMVQDPENELVFTWEGTLTAGELKFPTFAGDWCDGDWLLATVADQSLSDSSYNVFAGCPPEDVDLKWRVTAADTGTYIVTVDLENEKILFDKQVDETGIAPYTKHGIRVYPNPASDYLVVDAGTDRAVTAVSIYSLSGSLLYHAAPGRSGATINLGTSAIPPGMVIMKVSTEEGTETFRIIVE